MPSQQFRIGSFPLESWHCDGCSTQRIVRPAIIVVSPQPFADFEPVVWADAHVALLEESMKICTKQEAVVHHVRTVLREWSNVNSLESWQRMLSSDGAGSLVCIGDRDPKCTLAKTRSDDDW